MRADPARMTFAMRDRIAVAAIVGVIVLLGQGCATTYAPTGWSPGVTGLPTEVQGSWLWLKTDTTEPKGTPLTFGGELIAISADTIYIASPFFQAVPRVSVKEARLTMFDSYYVSAGSGVVAMTLLTPYINGWYGLFTAPMWIVGGTIAATARSYVPLIDYPGHAFEEMNAYARFPAGLPSGIDRGTLIMLYDRRRPFGF